MVNSRKLEAARKYFDDHLEELLSKYPDEYVAIIDSEVVVHSADLDELAEKVYGHFDPASIFVRKVETPRLIPLPGIERA